MRLKIFSTRRKYATVSTKEKTEVKTVPVKTEKEVSGLWIKCPGCSEIVYRKDIEENLQKCPNCDDYFRMSSKERVALLIDEGTFVEYDENISSKDFLQFPEYVEKLESSKQKTNLNDGVISGTGNMNGLKVSLAVMDFDFMGGSMGSVVGEKLTRAIERGIEMRLPVIIVSTSGGARMQEGLVSLMQMAKTSAALDRLREARLPYIAVPVNPTSGGVTASFAMLGDVIVSEPKTLIAFAGPRVIEQTIKQKLPEGFQKSEFLLEHGMVDVIAKREELKDTIHKILSNLV
jgi:acetyl-CoA carboxylase carboxyl transferase subunit beta